MSSRFPLFPDHEVLAEVGRGTIGTVYKVLSRRFRDVRALKRVVAPGPELGHRIKREFRRLALIDHPVIVRPTELFTVADALCLTSEFIEGPDLCSFLGRDAASDPERVRQAIYLTGHALKGLDHLHQKDIVHRGIKPNNLLVTRDLRLHMTDAALGRDDGMSVTDSGFQISELTAGWLSPEQLLGRPADARTDLYALGLVVIAALRGHRPLAESGPLAVQLQARMRGEAEDLSLGSRRLDRCLGPFFRRLLAHNPEGRYRSAAEALSELKRAWGTLSGGSNVSVRVASSDAPITTSDTAPMAPVVAAAGTQATAAPAAMLDRNIDQTAPMPKLGKSARTATPAEAASPATSAASSGTRKTQPMARPEAVKADRPAARSASRPADSATHTRPMTRIVFDKAGPEPPTADLDSHSTAEMRISDLHLAQALSGTSDDTLPRIGPALVGRADELRRLAEMLARAETGNGRLIAISGECGSGRSRLLGEFAAMARADGVPVLSGRPEDVGAGPMGSFAALLEAVARRISMLTPADQVRLLPADVEALAELSPALRAVAELGPVQAPDPGREARRAGEVRAGMTELVRNLAHSGPIAILLEDLHLADAPATALLAHLTRSLFASESERKGTRPPVLLAVTFRSDEVGASHPLAQTLAALEAEGLLERIELGRLGAADIARLAASMFGVEEIPADLARRLARDTGGNPLFVVETMRMLAEQSAIQLVEGRLKVDAGALTRSRGIKGEAVPERVKRVVEERLTRLPAALVEVLQIAALAGGDLRFETLREACARPEGELLDLLRAAVRARLLAEPVESPGRFVFDRDEVRVVLLSAMSATTQARLAARVAQALEHLLGARRLERAGDLAMLWERAGDRARAIEYLLAAGDERSRNGDGPGAIERWARLIEQVGLETGTARARHVAAELEARKRIARAHLASGELSLARGEFEELVRRTQATRRQPDEVDARNGLAEACWKSGDPRRAREAAGIALEKARLAQYTAGEAAALENLGTVARRAWDLKEASQAFREALKLRRGMKDQNGAARVLHNLGIVYRNQDQFEKARKAFEEARDAYTRTGDRLGIAVAVSGLAAIHLREDRTDAALDLFREARRHDEELGNPRGVALCDEGIGSAHLATGNYREALQQFDRSLLAFRAMGDRPNEAHALINLAHTYFRTGSHREAAKRYREALALLVGASNPMAESEARSGLGLALHALGERAAAVDSARAAVEVAHARGSGEKEAWARYTLAAVSGSIEEAQRALALAEAGGGGNLLLQLHHQIAMLEIERGNRERAREHFQKTFTLIDSLAEKSGTARDSFLKKPAIAAIFRDARKL